MEVVPGEGARRCRCQSPDHRQRLLRAARIPERYKHCEIQNFIAGDSEDSKWAAKIEADRVINDYLALDGRGLLFVGPVGVGKTHLAVALLRELIDRYRIPGLFYQFGALLKEIQSSYNPISETSELNVLKPVFEAEVLVLDELGSQKTTDWVRETLMYIINSRYNDKRLTIFTSNYVDDPNLEGTLSSLNRKLRDLQSMTNDPQVETDTILRRMRSLTEGSLEGRIGSPLRSRLYEMCKTVKIEGEDYRKTFANFKS
ncbi:MAG TPA: ATP-binding protein [Pyrinomonadaceae bacterium]|nr:ATP-binding protein [Pyrinomonadaceae bacterium]